MRTESYSGILRFLLGDYADDIAALRRPYEPIARRVPLHYNPEPRFGLRLADRRTHLRTPLPQVNWRVLYGAK